MPVNHEQSKALLRPRWLVRSTRTLAAQKADYCTCGCCPQVPGKLPQHRHYGKGGLEDGPTTGSPPTWRQLPSTCSAMPWRGPWGSAARSGWVSSAPLAVVSGEYVPLAQAVGVAALLAIAALQVGATSWSTYCWECGPLLTVSISPLHVCSL
jgi:hypothetical protein